MRLLGYADKLSVAPGECIRFMVSAEAQSYEATVVRFTRPDPDRDDLHFGEKVVGSAVDGRYQGRKQVAHSGSYVVVEGSSHLDMSDGLTIQTWVYPTAPDKGKVQGLLTRWSAAHNAGYGLFIGEAGDLVLWLGDEGGTVQKKIGTGIALKAARWYFVAGAYDAATGSVYLRQELVSPYALEQPRASVERSVDLGELGGTDSPVLIGGGFGETDETGKVFVRALYDGKIENPRVFDRALDRCEIENLKLGALPQDLPEGLVAAWDFGTDVSSVTIKDKSRNGLHGKVINAPTRAVTGHNWTGEEVDFRRVPEQYGAIHFHEDDLEDALWEPDFELTVPEDFESGVYAAHLTSEEHEEYIPFYVRPKKRSPTAAVAFLAPTNTYVAYANERMHTQHDHSEVMDQPLVLAPEDLYLLGHPELGRSLYDLHSDGSGCCHSSRLRPILNMRPKYRTWLNGAERHFAADLHLVGWLETKGHRYDVMTDEDLHLEGEELLAPYAVVITGSHPEYWTASMLNALERYLNNGGKLMYLGGNGFYWVTGIDSQRPHLVEVRRGVAGTRVWESNPGESHLSTTGEPGGIWRHRGKPPQGLVGVGFTAQGWGGATGYERRPDSHDVRASFVFEGIGTDEVIGDFGRVMGGAAGDELDRLDHILGTPPHALWLATSSGRHTDCYQYVVEDIKETEGGQGGTENPRVRADMVLFETPNGGAVFSVGSINWCGSLAHSNYENNVSRITNNVLETFLTRSLTTPPSETENTTRMAKLG